MFTELEYNDFAVKIGMPIGTLTVFLDDFISFYDDRFPIIINYFSGKRNSIEESHVQFLVDLIARVEVIMGNVSTSESTFTTFLDWELVDYFEDIKTELFFVTKTSKFLRSSLTNYNFTGTVEFDYSLKQGETLEDVAEGVIDAVDYNNDWVDIAQRNDLSELDYDANGSKVLVLGIRLTSRNSAVKGVIDNISGQKILGRDINKNIGFVDNDLDVLSYDKTAEQSVLILSKVFRGDIPEFKDFGRQPVIGDAKYAFALTTTIREMSKIFSSDDTLTDFTVIEIVDKGSDIYMKFKVSTRRANIINQNLTV